MAALVSTRAVVKNGNSMAERCCEILISHFQQRLVLQISLLGHCGISSNFSTARIRAVRFGHGKMIRVVV